MKVSGLSAQILNLGHGNAIVTQDGIFPMKHPSASICLYCKKLGNCEWRNANSSVVTSAQICNCPIDEFEYSENAMDLKKEYPIGAPFK